MTRSKSLTPSHAGSSIRAISDRFPVRDMRFLVVDDSVTMRRVIVNALQRIGYTDAIEAADGVDALGQFDESVGFIITDWNMPKMSGLELARAVRATPAGQAVPILMVTTRG